MSLEEELTINQFGQGVYSADELLDKFSELDDHQKWYRFFKLYSDIQQTVYTDSDVEQALAECSLDITDPAYSFLNLHRLTATSRKKVFHMPGLGALPEDKLRAIYKLILHLFRTDYQRRFALEKDNLTKWQYWDLSDKEVVQGILIRHQELVDEVYNTPGFRSEFVSLAKLWHDHVIERNSRLPEPSAERQTHFNFVTYDEMITQSAIWQLDKHMYGFSLLSNSLKKALAIRYRLEADEADRLMHDVVERHLQETYNTSFLDKW